MRKLVLLFFLVILFISPINAAENFIKVKVAGRGVNQIEALEDAFRNAVRKAVGAYVVTQSKLRNEDFDETIYINADAVVTQHRVLDKKIEDGLIVVQIEATVVKNNLLKYIPKKESSKIQDTDIANLLNKRDALDNAVQSLEYIFKDYSHQIYKVKRIGNFSVAANDDVSSDLINLEMDYEISFDHQAYKSLKIRLQNLLKKFAVAQQSGVTDNWDIFFRWWNDSIIYKFNDNNSWPIGTKTIIFIDEFSDKKTEKYRYTCYAIPNQIYQKINELTSDFNVIDFNFYLSGENEPLKRYLKVYMNFFFVEGSHTYNPRHTICFKNWMKIEFPGAYSGISTCKANFKATWRFTKEQVQRMKTCSLDIYAGKKAKYIWYWDQRSSSGMRELANNDYLPAMLAMAERFNEGNYWYCRAALRGSQRAQEQLGWKNGGLGFEISGFAILKGNKKLGITKGMIIKSINGNEPEYTSDLSELIGSFSVGDTVAVTFTNGKTINCTVLPLDMLTISSENEDEEKAQEETQKDTTTDTQSESTQNEKDTVDSRDTAKKEEKNVQEEVASANIPTEYDTQMLYNLSKILQNCLSDEGFNISNENLEKLRKYHNFKATFSLASQINEFFYCMTLIQDNLSYHRYLVPKENQKYVNKIIREQKCDFCKSNNRNKKKCSFCKDKQNDFLMEYTKQLYQELLYILQKHISDNL